MLSERAVDDASSLSRPVLLAGRY
eukprot:SAG22_NODE_18449_length_287_cov_0.819149_1_plen_23_part_01